MAELRRLIKSISSARKVLVIGHVNADPDALCSAFALRGLLKLLPGSRTVSVCFPEGVSRASAEIAKQLSFESLENADPSNFDLLITVDTNTFQQLGDLRQAIERSGKPIIVIDHHAPHPETNKLANLVFCDESSTSTCEIIFGLYKSLRKPIPGKTAHGLFAGIFFETGHLSVATQKTFRTICALLERGVDAERIVRSLRIPMDDSERIARIKAAQRTRLEHVGPWLIALSTVGSFHASAARALMSLGAHVAVVAGEREGKVTVSLRSTSEFYGKTNVHLGTDIAKPLGEGIGGMGGGHATAAGASVNGTATEALERSFEVLREALSKSIARSVSS